MKPTIKNALFALVIFSAIFGGSILYIQGMNEQYNTTQISTTITGDNETLVNLTIFDKLGEMETSAKSLESLAKDQGDLTFFDSIGFVVRNLGDSIKQIGTTFGLMATILSEGAHAFGLPPFFVTLMTTLIALTIFFGIIGFIFKRNM
jgi:hypothetical protein